MGDRRPVRFTAPWTWAGPSSLVRSPRPTENDSSADAAVDASALARAYKTQPLCSITAATSPKTALCSRASSQSCGRGDACGLCAFEVLRDRGLGDGAAPCDLALPQA